MAPPPPPPPPPPPGPRPFTPCVWPNPNTGGGGGGGGQGPPRAWPNPFISPCVWQNTDTWIRRGSPCIWPSQGRIQDLGAQGKSDGVAGHAQQRILGQDSCQELAKNLPRTCPGCQDYAGQVLAKILQELVQDMMTRSWPRCYIINYM